MKLNVTSSTIIRLLRYSEVGKCPGPCHWGWEEPKGALGTKRLQPILICCSMTESEMDAEGREFGIKRSGSGRGSLQNRWFVARQTVTPGFLFSRQHSDKEKPCRNRSSKNLDRTASAGQPSIGMSGVAFLTVPLQRQKCSPAWNRWSR